MISPRRLLPLPLLLIALAGAGCGDETTAKDVEGGGSEATATAEGGATESTPTEATTEGGGATSGSSSAAVKTLVDGVGDDLETAPKIASPEGDPPAELVSEDVVEGKGTAAKIGDTVEVRYTLVNWGGDDTPVDNSWEREPNSTSFPLEEGGLIPGWIKGVPGMKPGGRRVLVVPPADGYGANGTPDGGVPPNGTLIFVIDLVKAG
jgi:hypothetical protein